MDQGDPSQQHEDSNFNLYDTYGTGMDDDGAVDATFGLGGWDHHDHQGGMVYPDVSGTGGGYDPSTTNMGDFVQTDYGHQFQHAQSYGNDGQHYQDFMAQDAMGDVQTMNNQEFDLNAMDLYQHTASLYPNLTQEAANYELVDQNQTTPSSMSLTPNNSINSGQPTVEGSQHNNGTSTTTRQGFKFSPEQKQLMMDKFNAGLHYPTNSEKDSLAAMLGVSTESISRWFERTRKEKGVQRARKAQENKPIQMPQYHPVQPQMQQLQPTEQTNASSFPSYGQFPSTYPYNTLNPQFFQQNFSQPNAPPQGTTINPSTGMYAPIPFVNPLNQPLHPGMQNVMDMNSNGPQIAQNRQNSQVGEEMSYHPMTEGVYTDDTRNVKRPKIEPRLIPAPPKELAPKPKPPKKPMTFDEEVLSILRPAEWRDDPVQAAEDFYDLMGDAEDSAIQKLFLLRAIRNSATEIALRTISNEENRRILAKLRNWFTAAIKANDKPLLSVILEVIKKMNIDGRTMAGIKLGKPLILLMKKDEPTLKAQLASLQKTAYEAYALEKDGGVKPYSVNDDRPNFRLKEASPAAPAPVTTTTTNITPSNVSSTAPKAPAKMPVPADKPQVAPPSKIKVASKPAASFFGKLAQTPTIPKAPVLAKSIPKRPATTTASTAMIAGGAVKPPPTTAKSVPPKPTTQAPAKPPPSKFSVLEFINRGDSADNLAKTDTADTKASTNPKKRKHVSWAAEGDLERVQMIENITIKYAEDLFWHPPQAFGNARDLDIGEGRAFGKDTVEYDVEEEIEWYEPKPFDFTVVNAAAEDRGVKRAGNKVADAKEADIQKAREAGVLLVTYLNEGDIPDSPSEPFLEELVASSQQSVPPKVIPLPQELRGVAGVGMAMQSVKGQMATNPDVTAILSSLLGGSAQPTYQAPAPVQSTPDLASLLQSLSGAQAPLPLAPAPLPQATAIPANIDLSALLSHLQPQPPPQQQRWASPPPSTYPRREERHREPESGRVSKPKRDNASRIKASRQDDIRDAVRTSTADQNMYRALCQFYKTGGCRVGDGCTFVHPRDMAMYDQ